MPAALQDNWERAIPNSSAWFNATNTLAWLFNDSPVADARRAREGRSRVVVNDRWGDAARSHNFLYHLCEDARASEIGAPRPPFPPPLLHHDG